MSIPERVFIQIPDESGYGQFSWDEEKIDKTDVEYSRVTLAELAALRRVFEAARKYITIVNNFCEQPGDEEEWLAALAEYDKCRAA